MASLRIIGAAAALWLVAAGGTAGRRRLPRAVVPFALAAASAVSAALLAEELISRRGDVVTDAVLNAMAIDDDMRRHPADYQPGPGRRLRLVDPALLSPRRAAA